MFYDTSEVCDWVCDWFATGLRLVCDCKPVREKWATVAGWAGWLAGSSGALIRGDPRVDQNLSKSNGFEVVQR